MFRPSGKQQRKLLRLNSEQIDRLRLIIESRARFYRWHGDVFRTGSSRGQKMSPAIAAQKAFCEIVDNREFGWAYERGPFDKYARLVLVPRLTSGGNR